MARHLKIFCLEPDGPDLVLVPTAEGASFRYADLQMEANYVRTTVATQGVRHLVVDLSQMKYFGSEFIGALITICREKKNRGHKVAVCSAVEQMREVLEDMSLFRLWPYYETRAAAMDAVRVVDPPG